MSKLMLRLRMALLLASVLVASIALVACSSDVGSSADRAVLSGRSGLAPSGDQSGVSLISADSGAPVHKDDLEAAIEGRPESISTPTPVGVTPASPRQDASPTPLPVESTHASPAQDTTPTTSVVRDWPTKVASGSVMVILPVSKEKALLDAESSISGYVIQAPIWPTHTPTATAVPPTATPVPPTPTPVPARPTATSAPPVAANPASTPAPPTSAPAEPTATPIPPAPAEATHPSPPQTPATSSAAAPTAAAPAAQPAQAAAPAAQPLGHVYAVGDSVMLGAAPALRQSLGDVEVDGAVSRQASTLIGVIQARKASGSLGAVAVVQIGNNGTFTASQFDQILAQLTDVPLVVFVNLKVPRAWEASNNQVIAAGAARTPKVVLVDWHSIGMAHPEFFWSDGIHLRPAGAAAYAKLVVEAIASRR